jgi:hypothetical protein
MCMSEGEAITVPNHAGELERDSVRRLGMVRLGTIAWQITGNAAIASLGGKQKGCQPHAEEHDGKAAERENAGGLLGEEEIGEIHGRDSL